MKVYLVGGSLRDSLLGVKSKDLDYVVESDFDGLRNYLVDLGYEIYVEKPEFLTIRASRPDKVVVDFACCREETDYDGRRPGSVKTTSLYNDLARRDFTVNAMAQEVDADFNLIGRIIDPFDGQKDLKMETLRFVGNAKERLEEDGLRWFRAIRFEITKGFILEDQTHYWVYENDCTKYLTKVSVERIREELYKCFKHDTYRTIQALSRVQTEWLKEGLWLEPSLKK